MRARVSPSSLQGAIPAVASKSMAHRLLILNALAQEPAELVCNTSSQDIEATERCLSALATAPAAGEPLELDCGESGSTLRFLVPIVCAKGMGAHLVCHGRLAQRPLAPLDQQLSEHGANVTRTDDGWEVSGQLAGGRFVLPGDVSSQYISGLLMAAPLMAEPCEVWVRCPVQSRPYVDLTIRALALFGVDVETSKIEIANATWERLCVLPGTLQAQGPVVVEGDWSNAAFWLAAGALEPQGVTVLGLDLASPQGDRAILAALAMFGARIARKGDAARATKDGSRAVSLDVGPIPDLVPPLAAVAATTPGTTCLRNAGRLRLKESDRLEAICAALSALGGNVKVKGDCLCISGVDQLHGGQVDACNDHRIAMMAAILASHATEDVTILDAGCVAKSYPGFWDDYRQLGGKVELA